MNVFHLQRLLVLKDTEKKILRKYNMVYFIYILSAAYKGN